MMCRRIISLDPGIRRSGRASFLALALVATAILFTARPLRAQDTMLPPQVLGPSADLADFVLLSLLDRAPIEAVQVAGELKPLPATGLRQGDNFGVSVGLSGRTAVVGAWLSDQPARTNCGAAYVFDINQGGSNQWGQVKKLTANTPTADDRFGVSVAISGDLVVVGAYLDNTKGTDAGAAYVFARNQGGADNWGYLTTLTADDAVAGDRFGTSVAIDGDTIVAGAYWKDATPPNSGAAYVFRRSPDGASWSQTRLNRIYAGANDEFGIAVAVSGHTVAVGAWGEDAAGPGTDSGAVHMFELGQGTNWSRGPRIIPDQPASASWFGRSLALSGDTLVVGARGVGANVNSGSAFVFQRSGSNWTYLSRLSATPPTPNDYFGVSVGLDNDDLIVGAFGSRAAYPFKRSADGLAWNALPRLNQTGDGFGLSVVASQDTLLVGAYLDDISGSQAGAAYVQVNNLPPTAFNDSFTLFEDSTLSTNVLSNDADPEGGALTAVLVIAPTNNALPFILNTNGSFSYSPVSNYTGSDFFTYYVTDGSLNSSTATVSLLIIPVNDPPSFVAGTNQTVLEDAGSQTVAGWATAISPGPPDEAGQLVTFIVSNNNSNLFSLQPTINSAGTLTYMSASNAYGNATVTVQLRDDGGAVSPSQTFSIAVTPVNDPPSFTIGPNVSVLAGAGFQTVTNWAKDITPGPGETNQTTFSLTPTNSPLFLLQPRVGPTGDLTFTPNSTGGAAVFTVVLQDQEGTASNPQTFTITVTSLPIITITRSGTNVTLSWTLGSTYTLQSVSNLAQGWSNETNGGNFMTRPAVGPRRFFRVR